ncbi:MAG: aromatic ring-hydroxylating dioxygenase subunit alpha [Planctomycetota bacterium]
MSSRPPTSRAVESELDRFDPALPLERAWTPPASWYVRDDVAALEAGTVFAHNWVGVEVTTHLQEPGDYVAFDLPQRPGLLVRGSDGVLRGLHNVCRHHAAALVEGHGRCAELRCPYHGWVYGLDGALRRAPRSGGIADFRREDFALRPLATARFGPLAFVGDQVTGPTPERELADWLPRLRLDGLRWVARREYRVPCNWKVYVDNYLDGGYHVPVLHEALGEQLDCEGYRTELLHRGAVQSCAASADASVAGGGVDFAERIGGGADYLWIYPNTMLNRYGPVLDTNIVIPLSTAETLVVFDWFLDDECAGDEGFVARCLAASERVQREDEQICASVQRGLASLAYDRGRYAPKLEGAMLHFHRLLAADLHR